MGRLLLLAVLRFTSATGGSTSIGVLLRPRSDGTTAIPIPPEESAGGRSRREEDDEDDEEEEAAFDFVWKIPDLEKGESWLTSMSWSSPEEGKEDEDHDGRDGEEVGATSASSSSSDADADANADANASEKAKPTTSRKETKNYKSVLPPSRTLPLNSLNFRIY